MTSKKQEQKASFKDKGVVEDNSCELFFKSYRKNCSQMGIEMTPEIRKLFEEEWTANGKPINKVFTQICIEIILLGSRFTRNRLARYSSNL